MTNAQVIEGTFGRVTMDDLLQVVGMSRQCMEVVLSGVGSMTIKSGQVLQARSAPGETGAAAFYALYGSPGTKYAVFRRDVAPTGKLTPIGSVSALVERARRAPKASTGPMVVIEGRFGDTSLRELFDVLSVSRSTFEIALPGRNARMAVRGGQLLGIEVPGETDPTRALAALLTEPGGTFTVYRAAVQRSGRPLGALADLVEAAEELSEEYATVVDFPSGALISAPPASARTRATTSPPDDTQLEALAQRIEALQRAFDAEPTFVSEVLTTVAALEDRIRLQDERFLAWVRAARQDRWLIVLVFLVQLTVAAAVVGASVWTHPWTR